MGNYHAQLVNKVTGSGEEHLNLEHSCIHLCSASNWTKAHKRHILSDILPSFKLIYFDLDPKQSPVVFF